MHKQLIIFLASLLFIMPLSAQEVTEEAPIEPIQFAAFTLDNLNMNGIYPAGWEEVQAGAYVRNDDLNTSYILHLGAADATIDELLAPIRPSVQLEALPEPVETYESSVLEWTVYSFTYNPPELDDETLFVDLATAENEDGAYLILLQTIPDDYESLHEQVFLPAIDAFGSPLETLLDDYNITILENITLSDFGIESAVPENWQKVSDGSYMRVENQQDITTLLIQTSPDLEAEEFVNLLLERLALSVELPEAETLYETDHLSWSVHNMSINAQGVDVTFQIAIAQDENLAYLIVLLSASEEAQDLQDTVLLPILDVTKALDS